ncbi:GDSL esterase/lipase [Raphanus sativus]|nr:GDSL esterase/lipase [Raphanus sativus]
MATSKTIAVILFLITLVSSSNAAKNAKTKPLAPAILIFGDSSVDTGNNNYLADANFKANHIPYGVDLPGKAASGRFSNGKLYCDIVASKLHIKELVPPFCNLTSLTQRSSPGLTLHPLVLALTTKL